MFKAKENIILIRGAGDLGSGVALRLFKSGFYVVMCEIEKPSCIRRTVSFSQGIYDGFMEIEGVRAERIDDINKIVPSLKKGIIPLVIDKDSTKTINFLKPKILIDAILAKKNTGTNRDMAPFTIALGPGFTAGFDADKVIETKRGHYLGRVIEDGCAIDDTGIPGKIEGFGRERVIFSDSSGIFKSDKKIGDTVNKGDIIAYIDDVPLYTEIDGVIRGLLVNGYEVTNHFKCADVDPRMDAVNYIHTVSDKARAIAGGVLECVVSYLNEERNVKKKNSFDSADIKNAVDKLLDSNPDVLCAYVDGSYSEEKKQYSYAAIMIDKDEYKEFSGLGNRDEYLKYRNVAGEIKASVFAMNYALKTGKKKLKIFYDYKGIECWCTEEWKAKNDLTKTYKDCFDKIKDKIDISFESVKAHTDDVLNNRADFLAGEVVGRGR